MLVFKYQGAIKMRKVFSAWLRPKLNFEYYKDSYAVTEKTKREQLIAAAKRRLLANEMVVLFCHFQSTFLQLQDQMDRDGIEYEIAGRQLSAFEISKHFRENPGRVLLALAETIRDGQRSDNVLPRIAVSMIGAERHPLPSHDQRLEDFLRGLPFRVRLGYFLSLDEPTVRAVVNETTVQLLHQLGMSDHELITSSMVAKRIRVGLARVEKSKQKFLPATSPQEWWAINAPDIRIANIYRPSRFSNPTMAS
ncbi:MAG: hypothetical protein R3C03_15555 [Pirellulaceae bacterium]